MVQEFYRSELGWLALLMNNEENCENKVTRDISPSTRCFVSYVLQQKALHLKHICAAACILLCAPCP